jgi:hypothetical protein
MSSSEAAGPVNHPAGDPAMPGGRCDEDGGDPGGETAGGLEAQAAGGPGRAAGGTSRAPGRGLTAYLLLPRPDAWAKALIAPVCFVLAASATGRFGNWKRFVVLWLVLEFLIYAARYQWNDIRGIEADQRHAERRARSRLPVGATARARRRSVRLSQATAALRVLAALLIGVLAGLIREVLVLTGPVLVVAVTYEFLRSLPPGPSGPPGAARIPARIPARAVAVWLVVGLGYLVRGGLGLSAGGLAWGSRAMVSGLASVVAFGIMFVLLTWTLEATSYCRADAGGRWHARPDLAAKPHLAALLSGLGRPVVTDSTPSGPGRYCGADRVLRAGGRLSAPWNLALITAATGGGVEGLAVARPHLGGAGWYLAAAGVAAAGALLLARSGNATGRWVITAAWAAALAAVALLAGPAHAGPAHADPARALLAGGPWLAISSVYTAFHGWSYRDLVALGPSLAAALRRTPALRRALALRQRPGNGPG